MAVFLHFTGHSVQGQDLDPDGWQLSVMPYFWFSGIEGDVKVRGNEADVDVGFDDIWDALDFGVKSISRHRREDGACCWTRYTSRCPRTRN